MFSLKIYAVSLNKKKKHSATVNTIGWKSFFLFIFLKSDELQKKKILVCRLICSRKALKAKWGCSGSSQSAKTPATGRTVRGLMLTVAAAASFWGQTAAEGDCPPPRKKSRSQPSETDGRLSGFSTHLRRCWMIQRGQRSPALTIALWLWGSQALSEQRT